MKLSDKQYDIAKNIITIVMPALITLIAGLGELYGFDSELIIGTIGLVTVFFGTVLRISTKKIRKELEEKYEED